jgi:hypothetical protein
MVPTGLMLSLLFHPESQHEAVSLFKEPGLTDHGVVHRVPTGHGEAWVANLRHEDGRCEAVAGWELA